MIDYFHTIKEYLLELDYIITSESSDDGLFVIENESMGIKNAMLEVEDPILVIEQHIVDLPTAKAEVFQSLLMKNREIIHGAFVLDQTGQRVLYRNTHELDHLDLDELEATLNSLGILLNEFSDQIVQFSKS